MKNDYMIRLLALLAIVFAACTGLYFLPDQAFGIKIKRVDLLSALRSDAHVRDSRMEALRAELAEAEAPATDSPASMSLADSSAEVDSIALAIALRDSITKDMAGIAAADHKGERIEDYSEGHNGLHRFFAALNSSRTRPVRIAFVGDSFVEGDILTAGLRNSLQQSFGGRGVGFVPVTSEAARYRSTVSMTAAGWKTISILTDKANSFILSGLIFEPEEENPSIKFKLGTMYAAIRRAGSLQLIYDRNVATSVHLSCNAIADTSLQLPPADGISACTLRGDSISSGTITFEQGDGFRALGIVLEDETGVSVDNLALRGHSGLMWTKLDEQTCSRWNAIRPYDLIILQYGLNVATEEVLDYSWYRGRMCESIARVRQCFPEADLLLLGVSDRANRYDGSFATMPAVLALLNAQRKIAVRMQIPFWNTFGAMGGENSMLAYVDKGWAGKDYTHLSFRGGQELASALVKSLLNEKKQYEGGNDR
ncbi:MAG: hypothetical protein LBD21_00570 [Tannerellaceae bacterium]|jgi:hypothetical protein|nr:hypothetical protein [Tannerellaceae bacterium]